MAESTRCRSVLECKRNVTSSEFSRWAAYFEMKDAKRDKADYYGASVAYQVYVLRQLFSAFLRSFGPDKTSAGPDIVPFEEFFVRYGSDQADGPVPPKATEQAEAENSLSEKDQLRMLAAMKASWMAAMNAPVPEDVLSHLPLGDS